MSLLDRLKLYMEHLQMTVSQFADAAQIPRPTLSQILSGRNKKISNEVLTKLHDAYPDLNIAWLLFGDGPMCLDGTLAPAKNVQEAPSLPNLTQAEDASPKNLAPELPFSEIDSRQPIPVKADSSKRVTYITVFYSDNSFENFYPKS